MKDPKITLGKIIRFFKAKSTKMIREKNSSFAWQRNYYEHIIRNDDELNLIRQYIIDNPYKWTEDENNPSNLM
jgi:REP element-mobilizing transposase RayT